MQTVQYVKSSTLLLLAILPVSFIGYLFAADYENLFFVYEWVLAAMVIASGVLALLGAIRTTDKLRWVLISVLAFITQFSVLGLFLGPYSIYPMFVVFYLVTFLSIGSYVVTIIVADRYKFIPVILLIISVLFTLYMILLNSLWGKDLS